MTTVENTLSPAPARPSWPKRPPNFRYRYSDENHNWGPFTWSKHDNQTSLAVELSSGGGYDHGTPGCRLRITAFRRTLHIELPPLIRPWPEFHRWSNGPHEDGSIGYWDMWPREYGFSIFAGNLHVYYGPQTHDSRTTKSAVIWNPWTNWTFVRHSYYDLDHNLLKHFWERDRKRGQYAIAFAEERDWRDGNVPSITFTFKDFDGEEIEATCLIEERQWRLGRGWFRWLGWIAPPKTKRSLDLRFSKVVGPKKGSWKGGTIGHSCDIAPGEAPRTAFQRYCQEEGLTLL